MVTSTTKNKTETSKVSDKYYEAVGRRKTATARVRIFPAKKEEFTVNDKSLQNYFVTEELSKIVRAPLVKAKIPERFFISIKVTGSGIHSQAEAARHGITRALVKFNEELKGELKKAGFLKRDPRMKERKKFGLKKARKAAQWSKR